MVTGPDPRAAVRVGALERTMQDFNREMGQKVAMCLARYDKQEVAPRIAELQARIEALERPWWKRVLVKVWPPTPEVPKMGDLL